VDEPALDQKTGIDRIGVVRDGFAGFAEQLEYFIENDLRLTIYD